MATVPAVVKKAPKQPEMNVKQKAKRKSKTQLAMLKMRHELFPGVTDDQLWIRTVNDGFTTIPRTMPHFMDLINDMSKSVGTNKSAPAGRAYLVLWCRVFDDGILRIDNDVIAAGEAGYSGERSVGTWREHLRILKELGFIDYAPGPAGPCQYIVIFNPYHAVLKLKDQMQKETYTAILQRALEIGAEKDMMT